VSSSGATSASLGGELSASPRSGEGFASRWSYRCREQAAAPRVSERERASGCVAAQALRPGAPNEFFDFLDGCNL